MKMYSDDYYTVVAENREEAVKFFIDQELLADEEELEEVREIDPGKKKMWFPLDKLPEEYHNKDKHPRKNFCGGYIGVEITLAEAVKHSREKLPFVICVSSELI